MDCAHFDAGTCRSCVWLPRPYDDQVEAKQRRCQELLGGLPGEELTWLPAVRSPESGFRNKAKMVVSGSVEAPQLGILDEDIRDCGLHVEAIRDALPVLAEFVTLAKLTPYDVAARRGELKLIHVTASSDDELMVRFVSRSQEPVTRIQKHLPWLREALPNIAVVSVNLLPEHKAVMEGEQEILLTEQASLAMRVNGHVLHLQPKSFFQTNTEVAAALYREARAWTAELDPSTVWDLYCGVGGFAVHLASEARQVTGVETSEEAVQAARLAALESALSSVEFRTEDATSFALAAREAPDLIVVNPPRRGIGETLASWLASSDLRHVLYSSCNPDSLARDLEAMPQLVPVRARLFDMFPQTSHAEVLVLLQRAE